MALRDVIESANARFGVYLGVPFIKSGENKFITSSRYCEISDYGNTSFGYANRLRYTDLYAFEMWWVNNLRKKKTKKKRRAHCSIEELRRMPINQLVSLVKEANPSINLGPIQIEMARRSFFQSIDRRGFLSSRASHSMFYIIIFGDETPAPEFGTELYEKLTKGIVLWNTSEFKDNLKYAIRESYRFYIKDLLKHIEEYCGSSLFYKGVARHKPMRDGRPVRIYLRTLKYTFRGNMFYDAWRNISIRLYPIESFRYITEMTGIPHDELSNIVSYSIGRRLSERGVNYYMDVGTTEKDEHAVASIFTPLKENDLDANVVSRFFTTLIRVMKDLMTDGEKHFIMEPPDEVKGGINPSIHNYMHLSKMVVKHLSDVLAHGYIIVVSVSEITTPIMKWVKQTLSMTSSESK